MSTIRERVLRGLALNREPGLHFAGNLLGISFDRADAGGSRVSIVPGPHCEEVDGQTNLGVAALVADMALAACVRVGLDPATRLATVSLHLQLTGTPLAGVLEAAGTSEGVLEGVGSQQRLGRVAVTSGGRATAFGTGAFMVLKPPPGMTLHPVERARSPEAPALAEEDLHRDERVILARADDALAHADAKHSFIGNLLGYRPHGIEGGASCTMTNGAHVANRVGHVQGGLLVGLATATASAALTHNWTLSSVSAWFVSPGEGKALKARSRIVHHGRHTAVVRTEITGKGRRRVLEAMTSHALRR